MLVENALDGAEYNLFQINNKAFYLVVVRDGNLRGYRHNVLWCHIFRPRWVPTPEGTSPGSMEGWSMTISTNSNTTLLFYVENILLHCFIVDIICCQIPASFLTAGGR
jgi:hypothetical protein